MRYSAPGLFKSDSSDAVSVLQVRALLFYEGTHTDSLGKRSTYSADKIRKIADATNEFLSSGRRARFFADHEYSQKNVLGSIVGQVEAREIDTVPHEGMTGLIGKVGIYASIEISGEENVVAYKDGRIKEISVGIDLDGKSFGIKNAIYELSAVGIPALAGAALFAKTLSDSLSEMNAEEAQYRLMEALDRVWWAFRRTISDIGEAGGDTASAEMLQAARDFSDVLLAQFALGNPPPEDLPPEQPLIAPPTVPLFETTMEYTAEQIKELQEKASKFEAAERELATMRRSQAVSDRFSRLKDKATALRSAGKLTPATFKQMGFEDSAASVAKFSAGDDRDLDKLEIQLDTIEQYATPIKMGSHLSGEPLPGEEENIAADETANFMAKYQPNLRYSNSRSY
jgi:hypothetical protein